ncbi:MAG TPA: phasin family protein [Allosphingosinicella sp.]|nr:phasin family protein [Allosphingosinicella sp.]
MADTNTATTAPKADAPRAAEKAADAAPKAAAQAAPAAAKPVAAATAKAAVAPVKAAAKAAKRTTRSASAKRTTRSAPAKRAPARRTATKTSAPQRTAARTAARAVDTATTTNLNAINQGTRTMKNEARQAADRIQAVFGDVNERAKTAMERNSRIAEEMTELTKGNVEALVASTKIAAKAVETIGQDVAEFSRKSFDDASAALKGFAEIKSPADFFRLQGDFARSQFDTMVAETSKLSETMIKFAGQAAEPISGRYSVAAERVRNAVAI